MADRPGIFFIHIRKTAGTSIGSVLRKQYKPEEVCPIRSELELRMKVPEREDWKPLLTSYRYVGGHFYRIAPLLADDNFKVITFLRDPLDRAISAFNHIKNDQRDVLHKFAANLSFREAITEPKLAIEFRNAQARFLIGNAGFDFNTLSRQERLEAAENFLKRIDFFGFQELLSHSCRRLGDVLGVPFPAQVPELNREITAKGVRRNDVLKDIGVFEANNVLDREIYVRALQIFDQRFG